MLVDLDHLFANPVFEANRCSINFHPLHTYWAMGFYVILLFLRKPYAIIGLGLLFHMLTDLIDCLMLYAHCSECLAQAPAKELVTKIAALFGL